MTQIWAGMATLPERVKGRILSSESLIRQVDRLTICSGEEAGDIIKFASCGDAPDDAIFVCVDDDLVYPSHFIADLYRALGRHPKSIVGFHGWMVTPQATRGTCYPALGEVVEEQKVDVIATCACAWRVNDIRITPSECPAWAGDIWLMLKAEEMGIDRYVIPHELGYFGYEAPPRTIWDETQARTGSPMDCSKVVEYGCRELLNIRAGNKRRQYA